MKHIPVLLSSVLEALGNINGKKIIDATFGAGGYTTAFLKAGAYVVAFDRDPNVLQDAMKIKAEFGDKFTFIPKAFSCISELTDVYDAIVFDLGLSSMQIDIPERGFSFRGDGPLDMRMSQSGVSAADLIEQVSQNDLAKILRDYGDIKKSVLLSKVIKENKPKTTFELKNLIKNPKDVAPVFQALRIAVNDEMGELERALNAVPDLLSCGGKCICVTFHSLEDRIVKNTFRDWTTTPGDPYLPTVQKAPFQIIKAVTPTKEETEYNSRARSAHMRGVIKSC